MWQIDNSIILGKRVTFLHGRSHAHASLITFYQGRSMRAGNSADGWSTADGDRWNFISLGESPSRRLCFTKVRKQAWLTAILFWNLCLTSDPLLDILEIYRFLRGNFARRISKLSNDRSSSRPRARLVRTSHTLRRAINSRWFFSVRGWGEGGWGGGGGQR